METRRGYILGHFRHGCLHYMLLVLQCVHGVSDPQRERALEVWLVLWAIYGVTVSIYTLHAHGWGFGCSLRRMGSVTDT